MSLRHPGRIHRAERWLRRRHPTCGGCQARYAGRRCTSGDVRIRRPNNRGFLSLFHGLKLQSGVLKLAAGLGKLLSRLRQFFGQLGRHSGHLLCHVIPKYFGHFLCHMVPKLFELELKLGLDDVQFVVEVTVLGLLWASDFLARSFGRCGLSYAMFASWFSPSCARGGDFPLLGIPNRLS